MSPEPPALHWPEITTPPTRHQDRPASVDARPPSTGGACSAPRIPDGPCPVCPRLAQEFEPWRQAAYYKAMLDRAPAREALLKQDLAHLQAKLRLREQQLFGRKTEAKASPEETTGTADARRSA